MDSPSNRVTNVANSSHSSRRESVGGGAMANGVAGSSCESEEAEEVEGGGLEGGVRARVSVLASVGSVGSRTVPSADLNNKEDGSVSVVPAADDADQAKELEELAKLRCQSVATEVVAERYKRRCSDYPGFAFGSSIFSSNTMMKFSIIKNELHNIMNVQLKRVSTHAWQGQRQEGVCVCVCASQLSASQPPSLPLSPSRTFPPTSGTDTCSCHN